jgi:hypothetical protein
MCSVALEEAKLEETGFQPEIPQFKVTQVPPVPRSEFYMGSVLASEDVASGIRSIVIEAEISREVSSFHSFILISDHVSSKKNEVLTL